MTPWQRRARALVAVFAIVFAVMVAFALKRRPAPAPQPTVSRTDPVAVAETTGGRLERFKLSHEDVRVEYEKQLTYADGSIKLLGVRIHSDDRAGGRSFTVSGTEGRVGKDEGSLLLDGNVQLTSSDGLVARTEHAAYSDSDGVVKSPGPIEFSKGRFSGAGNGMTWGKASDILTILSQAVVHVAKDENGMGGAEITSASASFVRGEHFFRFDGGVHVDRGTQTLESSTMVARLTEDENRIQKLELRDNSRIVTTDPKPGTMRALLGRAIDLTYRDDGETLQRATVLGSANVQIAGDRAETGRQITSGVLEIAMAADGSTPTSLVARDDVQLTLPAAGNTPSRTIQAAHMEAQGDGDGAITRAHFVDNVRFREQGPSSERGANSALLDVTMQPGLGALEDAHFTRAVRFVDGKTTATAASAGYDPNRGRLELTGSEPGSVTPHIVSDQITIDATRMDVTLEGPQIKATGSVKSVLQAVKDEAGSTKRPSMLKADQPVNITANNLAYDGAAGRAVYEGGPALLWQTETSIKAATLTIDNKSGDLAGSGTVATSTMLDDVDKNKKTQRVRSIGTAKEFAYTDEVRRASYTGDAHLTGPQGDLTADKIELYLKPSGEELDRAEAYEKVALRDVNRKSTGNRLTYTAADGRYVIGGVPVTIVDECGRETSGKTLIYTRDSETIVVDGNEQTRTETKGGGKCP